MSNTLFEKSKTNKRIRHCARIMSIMTSILSFSVIISSFLIPLISYQQVSALKVNSISQTKGQTSGGDEIIVKGEGFLKEEIDNIWYMSGLETCAIGRSASQSVTNQILKESVYNLEDGSKIVLTKSGTLYEFKADDSVINLSETYNLGKIENIDVTSDGFNASLDNGPTLSVLTSQCSGYNYISLSKIYIPDFVEINGVSERCFLSVYDRCISESGYVVDLYDGSYDTHSSGLNDGEKITGIDAINEIISNGMVITTNYGRKLMMTDGYSPYFIDITDSVGSSDTIVSISLAYSGTYQYIFVLSSGYYFSIDDDIVSVASLLPGFPEGETIKYYDENYSESVILTESGKIFVGNLDEGNVFEELVSIPPVDSIKNQLIYLENGTIYGSTNGELFKFPDLDGEKITYMSQYGYNTKMLVSESGKIYTSRWDGSDPAYIGTLNPGEKVESFSSNTIITTQGRYLELDSSDNSNIIINDITSQIAPKLPLIRSPQIARLFFGSIEAAYFEIIDNNTIRATIPANEEGVYSISFISASGDNISTGLNYEYIDNSTNSEGNSFVLVPNTGVRRE